MKNRAGAYKNELINIETLSNNKALILSSLASIEKLQNDEALYTGLYLLLFLRLKHSKNWLQRKSKLPLKLSLLPILNCIPKEFNLSNWEQEKLRGVSLEDLFLNFNLKGFPASINRTMLAWLYGEWNIVLFFHVPNSKELIALQAENKRCITLITTEARIDTFIFKNRDPLSFALHDIMHTDQFFNMKETTKGQIGFYKRCLPLYDHPKIKSKMKEHKEFKYHFEYATSDMNAYVIHLLKCLKHALFLNDQEGKLFLEVLKIWQMNEDESNAAIKLNTENFNIQDELILKNYFENI